MRRRDEILLAEAYDRVNESKNITSFGMYAKFWDMIAYAAQSFAASALDRDSASSMQVWDWLRDLETNPREMKDYTSDCLDHIRDEFQTEGLSWNKEIEQQFTKFFYKVLQSEDPKVAEALSSRDDYTKELDLKINYEDLKPETKEVFKNVLGVL